MASITIRDGGRSCGLSPHHAFAFPLKLADAMSGKVEVPAGPEGGATGRVGMPDSDIMTQVPFALVRQWAR
jgi:hypothetical protein